jgi:hypothetical protein
MAPLSTPTLHKGFGKIEKFDFHDKKDYLMSDRKPAIFLRPSLSSGKLAVFNGTLFNAL